MKLEELIDELRVNILRDDAELASGPDDRLWSDDALVRYLNDAQRRFARRALVLRDSTTTEVVEVTLATGVSSYTLHKSVRAVVSARYDTDATDLLRIGHRLISEVQTPEYPSWDVNIAQTMTPGRPLAYSTDESLDLTEDSSVVLTVYPAPTADENGKIVRMRVARMPLRELTLDEPEEAPEVPEEYHLDLCEWAAFRALRNSDIDGHSDRATKHEARFTASIDEVKRDQRSKMFAPMTWEFGAHGFRW